MKNTSDYWFGKIQEKINEIREWSEWESKPYFEMKNNQANEVKGRLALYSYYCYTRRFTLLICSVLSKMPEADERFWRLAVNLYDELGEEKGLSFAHGKLIQEASHRPSSISRENWELCKERLVPLEIKMTKMAFELEYPINLFALGPGTESISDLFLKPLENWTFNALQSLPKVKNYFEVHYPEVEFEHQLEIAQILSEELGSIPMHDAQKLFSKGVKFAELIAKCHLNAVASCWENSVDIKG